MIYIVKLLNKKEEGKEIEKKGNVGEQERYRKNRQGKNR